MTNNLKAERTLTAEPLPCPFCGNPAVEAQYNGPNEDQIKAALMDGSDWDAAYFVACWCGATGPERADEEAAIRAWNQRGQSLSTQQPMGEVRVKTLEWSSVGPTRQAAETILGWYHIDRRWNMEDPPVWYWKRSGGWLSACETEGEAKAAAQADYNSRILSALHPNQESGE